VDGTAQTVQITANCDTAGTCATALSSAISGATATVVSGNIVLTSDTTGANSSVEIRAAGPNVMNACGGSVTHLAGAAASAGTATGASFTPYHFDAAATAGTLTGTMTAYDFSTQGAEDLVLTIDGASNPLTVSIAGNCDTTAACATILNAAISGATVSASGTTSLVITSDTPGASSGVALGSSSGTNVKALFGSNAATTGTAAKAAENLLVTVDGASEKTVTISGNCELAAARAGSLTGSAYAAYDFSAATQAEVLVVVVDGTPRTASISADCTTAVATAATLTGAAMTAYDFACPQSLVVVVDGTSQTVSISGDCDTAANCKTILNTAISGASVTNSGTSLVITSDTTGAGSSVAITAVGSGANATALFGSSPTIVQGLATGKTTCASNISIAGATVTETSGGNLAITSDTTGTSSSVVFNATASGANARALFGSSPVIVAGVHSCATLLSNSLSTANVAAAVTADGNNLKIVASSTGATSSVAINAAGSGVNAAALFAVTPTIAAGSIVAGTATAATLTGESYAAADFSSTAQDLKVTIDGGDVQDVSINVNCVDATQGTLTGGSFTAYDFSSENKEYLQVVVDGTSSTVTISTAACNTGADDADKATACATALDTAIGSGATVAANSDGKLVITSASKGTGSSVTITNVGSGTNALALFGSTTSVAGVIAGPLHVLTASLLLGQPCLQRQTACSKSPLTQQAAAARCCSQLLVVAQMP